MGSTVCTAMILPSVGCLQRWHCWSFLVDDSIVRNVAQHALQYFFQVRPSVLLLFSSLITFIRFIQVIGWNPRYLIYLPLLLLPSSPTLSTPQVAFSVYSSHSGNIHTSSIGRTTPHRRTVTDRLPQVERQPEVKSRRGWEKTSALSSNTTFLWVSLGRQRKRTLRSL